MRLPLVALVVLVAVSGARAASGPGQEQRQDLLVSDMREPGEARPHGVPSAFGWPVRPLVQAGNEPGDGFNRLLPWLQVYEEADGSPANNTRVQMRNLTVRVLGRHDGLWQGAVRTESVTGAMYVESYAGDQKHPAALRPEASGGVSVVPGGGYCFHAWSDASQVKDMIPVARDDVGGVFVSFEARLVVDDPARPDDRRAARFVASAGADYWKAPAYDANKGVAIGRFKRVTPEWRTFTMTTAAAGVLAARPPL